MMDYKVIIPVIDIQFSAFNITVSTPNRHFDHNAYGYIPTTLCGYNCW